MRKQISTNNYRIQFYYPTLKFTKKEIYITANTAFHIIIEQNYKGVAFTILGFGFGFDNYWYSMRKEKEPRDEK